MYSIFLFSKTVSFAAVWSLCVCVCVCVRERERERLMKPDVLSYELVATLRSGLCFVIVFNMTHLKLSSLHQEWWCHFHFQIIMTVTFVPFWVWPLA